MKNLLLVSLCLFSVVGCQTYPKNPTYISYGKFQPVNRTVPIELQPFELPAKVEYVEATQSVPKQIIVVQHTETMLTPSVDSAPIIVATPPSPIVTVTKEELKEVSNVKK